MTIFGKYRFISNNIVFWFLYICAFTPLLLYFNWPFARDSAVYVAGFEALLKGVNPYENGTYRSGLFGSALMYFIALLVPLWLESCVFLALNILGTVIFMRFFIGNKNQKSDFFLLVFAVWSSASREGLNTIQITGILLGLLTFVFKGMEIQAYDSNKVFSKVLGVLCAAIVIDLKPHYVLPLFALLLFKKKCLGFALTTILTLFIGHLLIDLVSGKFLTLEWFRLMINLANEPIDGTRRDFTNIWSLTSSLIDLGNYVKFLPYILILCVVLVVSLSKSISFEQTVYVGLLLPLLSTYTHFYDYLGIVALTLVSVARYRNSLEMFLMIPLILIAENWQSFQGLSLIGFFFMFFIIVSYEKMSPKYLMELLRNMLFAMSLFFLVHLGQDFLVKLGANPMSLSATLSMAVLLFFYSRSVVNSKKSL
jgi:hypothetical protein